MLNWLDERMKEEQLCDIFRDVHRRRVVRQALAARPAPSRFYTPALVQLGCWLVAWGCRLQARFGVIAEGATIAQAAIASVGADSVFRGSCSPWSDRGTEKAFGNKLTVC